MNRSRNTIALFVGRPVGKIAIGGNISKISIELSGGPLRQTNRHIRIMTDYGTSDVLRHKCLNSGQALAQRGGHALGAEHDDENYNQQQ